MDRSTGTATLVRAHLSGFYGDASLYRLDPPLEGSALVAVSATVAPYTGPETYIFPANSDGSVTDWGELPGSTRGTLSHVEALHGAGYEVAS